ncbi:hypothetical protein HPB51_000585 [Rhipicephalus microplus]|uniref:Uncharacterized protein n=1 Tax=Rhipicephalus microplus TaxID=6941 RepID=A0A9J6DXT3_RHIMP|nr:hypothetical protein HPB51_000585 [Rhipicephalus microplus]
MTTNLLSQIRPQVHYAHMPKGVGSADICRELVKHFKLSELKCVQKYGMGKFEVTFANDEASRRFSDNPVLAIHDARIRFQYRGVRVKVVRVTGFPADADVRIIAQLLGMYGVVLDVSREESAFLQGVLSGIPRGQNGDAQECPQPPPASPAGASESSPADAPTAEDKKEPMSWTDAARGKKRRAGRSPGPSKEKLAAAPSGGPGSQKDDLPVVKQLAATVWRGIYLVDCHEQYRGA